MSLRGRVTLLAAGVVALVVAMVGTGTYFLMRHEFYAQVDSQLESHANDRTAVYGDLST